MKSSQTNTERERQRQKQAAKALAERDISILPPADPTRRAACLADVFLFLTTYFGATIFTQPFTPDRRAMVEAMIRAATYSGDFAVAGPRGEGKTKLALFVALWLIINRKLRLPIIIGKNTSGAENELDNLKRELTGNELFAADFPEICVPLIALDGWASRARKQTVNGHHTDILWRKDCLFLPTIPQEALGDQWPVDVPSLACGQGIATVGIDGKIRGYNRRNIRPDLAIVDDIDDRSSARSTIQTTDFRTAIDADIAGLAGSGQRTARVMLCTLINSRCVAAIYTDRKKLPGWQGQRFKAIAKLPDAHETLWVEYIELRTTRDADNDPDARVAHRFYLANRAAMDAGAVVSNEHSFEGKPAADGEPLEVSALQACYNKISDIGWPAFCSEYQNDPLSDEAEISKADISRELVQRRLSGFNRRELPPACKLVAGIDLGKYGCHWVVGAFREGGAACICDYGVIEVRGTEGTEQKELIERAILRALSSWKDEYSAILRDADGNPSPLSCVLIDSGYSQDAAFEFVRQNGEPYRASKGTPNFHHGQRSQTRRVGNHWFATPQQSRVWLYSVDADHWKRAVHHRFLCEPLDESNRPAPGSLTLFIPQGNRNHKTYSAHIMAEEWITEFVEGKGERSRWLAHSGNNHYFDATALMLAAAEMAGMGMFNTKPKRPPPSERPTAMEIAGRK